jgi:ATP-binding cassette subfamily F protein uup
LFTRPSNVLVLDEPTNDLDIETLELLESLLVDYSGTVLLVSHDRAFLNEVVTSVLAVRRDGEVKESDGGYDDYLRQQSETSSGEPKPAARPKASTAEAERPRKLSNKERRELDELPARIEALEESRQALLDAMAGPSFYRADGAAIAEAKARLDAFERDLAEAYGRWEALEGQAG